MYKNILFALLFLVPVNLYAQAGVDPGVVEMPPGLAHFVGVRPPTDPDEIKRQVRAGFLHQREYLKVKLEMMSDPEVAKLLADFSWEYFTALKNAGFNEKDAMLLVQSVGLPNM